MSSVSEYSLEELKAHTSPKELWIAIRGKIYNVSKFLNEHPGGEEILIDQAGTDATDEFDSIGHSEQAQKLLEDYYIGDLSTTSSKKASVVDSSKPKAAASNPSPSSPPLVYGLICAIVVVVLGIAYTFYY